MIDRLFRPECPFCAGKSGTTDYWGEWSDCECCNPEAGSHEDIDGRVWFWRLWSYKISLWLADRKIDWENRHWAEAAKWLAEVDRLTERCAAYRGQVETGAQEIERLTRANEGQREQLTTAINTMGELRRERDEARAALRTASQALDDWIVTYADDMCTESSVTAAAKRIADGGGTLAYIARVHAKISAALADEQQGDGK